MRDRALTNIGPRTTAATQTGGFAEKVTGGATAGRGLLAGGTKRAEFGDWGDEAPNYTAAVMCTRHCSGELNREWNNPIVNQGCLLSHSLPYKRPIFVYIYIYVHINIRSAKMT